MLFEIRFAFRSLWHAKGFTAAAILTLALAIAINTAIFSLLAEFENTMNPPGAERVYCVHITNELGQLQYMTWEQANYFQRSSTVFDEVGIKGTNLAVLREGSDVTSLPIFEINSELLRIAQIVRPRLGRLFQPGDDASGAPPVILLSYQYWQTHFGGRESVVGQTMNLNGQPYAIVGVLPEVVNSVFSTSDSGPGVNPVSFSMPGGGGEKSRFYQLRVGLKEGFSPVQAQAELSALTLSYRAQYPGQKNANLKFRLTSFRANQQKWFEVGGASSRTKMLWIGSLTILVVACANVAALFLSQIARRAGDIRIRLALGASMPTLFRQFAWESLIFCGVAGALGWMGAYWVCALLRFNIRAILPVLAPVLRVELDWPALGFMLAAVFLVALGCAAAPLRSLRQARQQPSLVTQSRNTLGQGSGSKATSLLLVSQIALAMTVLTSATILASDFMRRATLDVGFNPKGLASVVCRLPIQRYVDGPAIQRWGDMIMAQVQRSPEVKSVALEYWSISPGGFSYRLAGAEVDDIKGREPTSVSHITPGFIGTFQTALLAGRDFTAEDRVGTTPVCIVSERVERELSPGVSLVGREIVLQAENMQVLQIVGVIANMRRQIEPSGPILDVAPAVYRPLAQGGSGAVPAVFMHARSGTRGTAGLRKVLSDAVTVSDPQIPKPYFFELKQRLEGDMAAPKFIAWSTSVYAVFALFLAVLGLFSVVANTVVQRTAEIGVRMALGGTPSAIVRMLVWEKTTVLIGGIVAGIGGSLACARILQSIIAGFGSVQWIAYGVATVIFLSVGVVACVIPARRATRVDPLIALRSL